MRTNPLVRSSLALIAAVAFTAQSFALDLVADLQKAMKYDPTFQTAIADRQAGLAGVDQAKASYYPGGTINNSRMATDSTSRTTLTLSQPIINLDKLATFKQGEPKLGLAEANYLIKYQDLATRLLKATNAIVLANESIKLNEVKMASLNQQSLAAQRKLQLGQGTITDQRDIEVKAAQAKAQHVAFKTQLEVALKLYTAITGERPKVAEFVLPEKHASFALKPLSTYIDQALGESPALSAVKFSLRIAELDVEKATGALLPTLDATFSDSKSGLVTNKYTAVVLNMPLQSGSYYGRRAVVANLEKSKESKREAEEKAKVDIERLLSQVSTGFEAISIQQDAISAAQLSLEANIKSYDGGVRSAVDVLNATQTVFQVKSDYVGYVAAQTENFLAFMNLHTSNPEEALQSAFKYLFGR